MPIPILLRPYKLKTYIYTFKIEIFSRPYFTNLINISFLDVLDLSLLKYDQNTLEYIVSVNGGVARKRMSFYLKC